MKIMSINCGSSSLKFKLFEMPQEEVITEGQFERIGFGDQGIYKIKYNGEKHEYTLPLADHSVAVEKLLNDLIERNIIKSYSEINGVGHRVVQGGKYFKETTLINEYVKSKIVELKDLAPLHNGANIIGIEAFEKLLPGVPQTAIFDTQFHVNGMKDEAFIYAVPYKWYSEYGIRKYGAHGTSHQFLANEYARINNKDVKDLKIITCHIGNGASICAIDGGVCKDTSMGLTPLEGIPMGTRSGNVDPTIVSYISVKENKDATTVVNELNKKSGYLGVSEFSNDARDIEEAYDKGDEKAILAFTVQEKRIADYIGSYYVYLGGVDAIIFSAGIGENMPLMRKRICDRIKVLGVEIEDKLNNDRGHAFRFSTEGSKVDMWVIPTNEELVIARDTVRLITK